MSKSKATKRSKTYDKKLQLKETVELHDLLGVALRTSPAKETKPKAKRAKGKKK